MSKGLACTVMFALLSPILRAQPAFDYGSSAELKGVKRVFVYTGAEMGVRNNILKNIRKDLPQLIVADRMEDAEVHLVFTADSASYIAGLTHGQQSSSVDYRTVVHGRGLVIAPQPDGRLRLLMEFGDSRATIFERRPSTNFARAFVKAFKAANGLK